MKLKELIELMKNTEIISYCPSFNGINKDSERTRAFTLNEIGYDSYGRALDETFLIKKENLIIKKFGNLSQLLDDQEVLEMEVVSIPKMDIKQYINHSVILNISHYEYYGNNSQIIFEVR